MQITWKPQVLGLAIVLTGLAAYSLFLGHVDVAGMAVVAIAGALSKLVD